MGGWADGLITAGASYEGLKKIVKAFREGGGEGKPMFLQSAISYAFTKEEALRAAHRHWRHAALDSVAISDLATPKEFDRACANIPPAALEDKLRISADENELWDSIQRDGELGFDAIYLHQVSGDLPRFFETFGERIRRQNAIK
jgi:hypothetical protein